MNLSILLVATMISITTGGLHFGTGTIARERNDEYEWLWTKLDDPVFAERRRAAIATLNATGRVQTPRDVDSGRFLLRALTFHIEYAGLEPSNDLPQVNDALLKQTLPFVPEVETVSLQLSHVTSAGLGELKQLKRLEDLGLLSDDPVAFPSKLDDDSMSVVAQLHQLRYLTLVGLPVTNKGVQRLSSLPNLQSLTIAQCSITTDVFLEFVRFPKLKALHFRSGSRLNESIPFADLSKAPTPEVLDAIRRLDGRLQEIEIDGIVHPDIFRTIMPLTSLKEIRISSPDLTVELLDETLPTMCQDLSTLKLPMNPTSAQERRIQELLKRKTTQFPPR